MNSHTDLPWAQPEQQFEPIVPNSDDEFSNLLDLDLDINFPSFDANGDSVHNHDQPLDVAHSGHAPQQQFQANRAAAENAFRQQQYVHMQQDQQRLLHGIHNEPHMQSMPGMSTGGDGFAAMNMHVPYGQPQMHQHPQFHDPQGMAFAQNQQPHPQHHFIPPTPNSIEMQADAEKYLARMDPQMRAALEQRYQLRTGDPMSFTPIGTPAVTPVDNSIQPPPEFTVPGAYFSPLTSPMLEAQRNSQKGITSNPRSTASSVATSPANVEVDMPDEKEEPAKKLRKKISNSTTKSASNVGRIRQSPISRAQRKKGTMSGTIPSREIPGIIQDLRNSNILPKRPASAAGLRAGMQDSSGTESISPEPLSEAVMRPPPKPSSKTQSPAIQPESSSASASLLDSPATPASLMRIPHQEQDKEQPSDAEGTLTPSAIREPTQRLRPPLEELSLPEAAQSTRPPLPAIDTSSSAIVDDQSTPRVFTQDMSAQSGTTVSTPTTIATPSSTRPSSRSKAIRSPTGPLGASGNTLKIDGKGARSSKKRNSTSSALVSPALRPKISPSIRPLLPESANVTDDHHASLLARKSNYQNLIDGTRLPGVHYPQELSTNLTSKRTSHKIAEQGRRNRINTALQEMQSLLPSSMLKNKDSKISEADSRSPMDGAESPSSGKGGKDASLASAQNNSKAATVEMAILYIRHLKQEAEQRDQELDELKKRLEQASPNAESSGASSASSANIA
ncbi:MAG: hypothetical protein M1820_006065 [Bogoriella megaspora]|nr:MAG: hypothetical protein M1820_006065 [Bogoriella megaspora]